MNNFEMRKLNSADIFPMSKILKKIGFSEIQQALADDSIVGAIKDDKDIETIGINVAFSLGGVIINNLEACEKEIYDFLSSLTGAKIKELKECSLAEFAELIIALVQKEEFKDFMKVVSKLFK